MILAQPNHAAPCAHRKEGDFASHEEHRKWRLLQEPWFQNRCSCNQRHCASRVLKRAINLSLRRGAYCAYATLHDPDTSGAPVSPATLTPLTLAYVMEPSATSQSAFVQEQGAVTRYKRRGAF